MIETIGLYKILSLGFSYPEEGNWQMMGEQITASQGLIDGELLSGINAVEDCLKKNREEIDLIRSDYMGIFDMGRKISPYETEYIAEKVSRKPFELADVAGFYRAFGFAVAEDRKHKESLDHIAIELEFMAVLTWKHAYAKSTDQEENLKIMDDARLAFFRDHLASWGFSYCRQIGSLTGYDFYRRLAELYKLLLVLECDGYALDAALMDRQVTREPYEGVRGDELTCN